MSILNGPRINFWGGISTNVCVANNSDQVGSKTNLLDVASAQVGSDGQSMTDADIIALMRTDGTVDGSPYYSDSGWNYYGDHQVTFSDAVVSSSGAPGSVSTTGTIINQPIYLLGSVDPVTGAGPYMSSVMVDLDPTASISTQIFIGGLMIGSPENPKLHIVEDVVANSHNVFAVTPGDQPGETNQGLILRQFYRDPDGPGSAWASGTFQVTFSRANVKTADMSDPAIAAIMNASNMDGIVLRFQMFEMFPELTTPELQKAYANNQNPSNPSVGRVVGTLAPHFPGEPMTDATGREIIMDVTNLVGYFDVDVKNQRMMLDALALYPKGYFRADRKNIGSAYPIEANVDYGTNTLKAGNSSVPFSPNPTDYYLYGGIVDINLGAAVSDFYSYPVSIKGAQTVTLPPVGNQIAIGPLLPNNQTSFSAVESLVRIFGDDRNIYIDDHDGVLSITLNVAVLGKPTPLFDEPGGNLQIAVTSGNTGTLADGDFLQYPSKIVVAQMATSFSFTIQDTGDLQQFGFMTLVLTGDQGGSYFLNVRKYPKSDFGIPAGSSISWPQAYENALRYFYVTFPAMSMRLPLNDEGTMRATSDAIQARISDAYRGSTLYMPITRSMTPSQRALLTQFLNNQTWQPLEGASENIKGPLPKMKDAAQPYLSG